MERGRRRFYQAKTGRGGGKIEENRGMARYDAMERAWRITKLASKLYLESLKDSKHHTRVRIPRKPLRTLNR